MTYSEEAKMDFEAYWAGQDVPPFEDPNVLWAVKEVAKHAYLSGVVQGTDYVFKALKLKEVVR